MKKIIVIVLVLCLVVSFAGCRRAREEVAEKMIEERLEKQGIDVDIEKQGDSITIESEEGDIVIGPKSEWPNDAPKVVPEFKKGKIESSATMAGNTILNIKCDKYKDASDYLEDLKSSGWKEMMKMESEDQITYVGSKDGIQLTVSWQEGQLTIAWNKQ